MNLKTNKILVQCILIIIVIGISAWLGDYAAAIMSTSTTVKNGMLCQIIFLAGLITGAGMCLTFHELDRRYPSPYENASPEKEQNSPHE